MPVEVLHNYFELLGVPFKEPERAIGIFGLVPHDVEQSIYLVWLRLGCAKRSKRFFFFSLCKASDGFMTTLAILRLLVEADSLFGVAWPAEDILKSTHRWRHPTSYIMLCIAPGNGDAVNRYEKRFNIFKFTTCRGRISFYQNGCNLEDRCRTAARGWVRNA